MNLVLKSIFAGFLSWYFENIDETPSFFTNEYCAMTNERWRHYPNLSILKSAVITVKVVTKIDLNTKFVI